MQERLAILYRFVQHSLDKYARNGSCVVAVEKTFVAHNSASSLALAMARGALLTACANYTVYEYSPATIKRIVAGNGQADKEAVLAALPTLLKDLPPVAQLTTQGGGKRTPLYDASDALAIALCCALRDGGGERLSA
jgi:crossover junction endodeoxyribonuclease RuvC